MSRTQILAEWKQQTQNPLQPYRYRCRSTLSYQLAHFACTKSKIQATQFHVQSVFVVRGILLKNAQSFMAFFWSSRGSRIICKMFCWAAVITNWLSHFRRFRSFGGNRRLGRCRVFSFILKKTAAIDFPRIACTGTKFWPDMVLTCSPAASVWVVIVMLYWESSQSSTTVFL